MFLLLFALSIHLFIPILLFKTLSISFSLPFPHLSHMFMGFPGDASVKNLPANAGAGDMVSIPGLGRSPGGGHGNPLQYSCLENPDGQSANPNSARMHMFIP